ncbi:enoyl-CoA hydratase/isomerase family protein [Orbus sturtevantii]|uniref:enoyl-CoA hydratase/isomerase family protein n=1 Tax=Orbus sturtevantii TaxID=3074109 RepID=UPI00370D0EFA
MIFEHIKYEVKRHIGILTLNRPEAYNALSNVMRDELRTVLIQIEQDPDIRVLIITGQGKAFCAGGDVKLMVSRMESGLDFKERREIFRNDVAAMVKRLYAIKIPVIAAINGGAYGAGVSISLLCDMRVAADNAKFGFSFAKRGLIPDWGANYFLPRLIGYAKAMELVACGKVIDSQEALACGLVNQVTSESELMDTVLKIAEGIALASPNAIAESKNALRFGLMQSMDEALEYEATTQSLCQLSSDHKEGVLSFVEKREPTF